MAGLAFRICRLHIVHCPLTLPIFPKKKNMKHVWLAFFLFATLATAAQTGEESEIKKLLLTQTESWNRGDLEGFMQTYWKSDSLMFIGKNGVKWGWQQTLENYRKGYPDTTSMGKLSFDILVIKKLSPDYYHVVGKWMLKRTIGDLSGHYNLLLRKIDGRWVIVADHSS
jgi:ketosteroid isomerase-like protein